MEEKRTPTVVHRPEPPDEDAHDAALPRRTKLTPDEARALLAVSTVPKGPWGTVKRRLRVAFLALTLVSIALRLAVGWDSTPAWIVDLVLTAAAVAWVAWPLVTRQDDGWT